MKNLLTLFILLQIISSCNEPKPQKEEKPEPEAYTWRDYPNKDTKSMIIYTGATVDDKDLITQLEKDFKKDKFKLEIGKSGLENSFDNCKDNVTIYLKGKGNKNYYVKRTEAKPKNYYPDFSMSIYEFETTEQAIIDYTEIQKAFGPGNGFCHGKQPEYIVRYKNKIIHLDTRAEMFRDYIKKYADKIEKLNK